MAWYQCSCGFLKELAPKPGSVITSVSHLHRSTRLDGTASIVRMEEIGEPVPESPRLREELAGCRPHA